MSQLDINEGLDKQKEIEEKQAHEIAQMDNTKHESTSNKHFYVILAVLVAIFIALIAFQKLTPPTGAVTFDDLHQLNLNGDLDESQGYIHNGFSFVLFDGLWYTNVLVSDNEQIRVPLHYGPRDVENITPSGELGSLFAADQETYITVNPISDGQDYIALAASELAQNLAGGMNIRPIGACDRNETGMCNDRVVVNCTTADHPMIYLVHESGPKIEYTDKCIILRGENYDLVKAADRLILQMYGIV